MTAPIAPAAVATPAAASAAPAAAPAPDPAIREAAEGFEGVFMSILVKEMLGSTELTQANPLYAGLMTERLGDQLARSGGIGLADLLVRGLGGPAPAGSPS